MNNLLDVACELMVLFGSERVLLWDQFDVGLMKLNGEGFLQTPLDESLPETDALLAHLRIPEAGDRAAIAFTLKSNQPNDPPRTYLIFEERRSGGDVLYQIRSVHNQRDEIARATWINFLTAKEIVALLKSMIKRGFESLPLEVPLAPKFAVWATSFTKS